MARWNTPVVGYEDAERTGDDDKNAGRGREACCGQRRYSQRFTSVVEMTGEQSRQLHVGDRVCWQNNRADQGTIAETNWAGVTIKWDNRSKQAIHHNDMAQVEQVPNKVV
jgi:hypothetical protein